MKASVYNVIASTKTEILKLWNMKTGQEILTLAGHTAEVLFFACHFGEKLSLYNLSDNKLLGNS